MAYDGGPGVCFRYSAPSQRHLSISLSLPGHNIAAVILHLYLHTILGREEEERRN